MARCQYHNGIRFKMFESKNARGEFSNPGWKYHLDGKFSITVARNQYKYGDELILQVYSPPEKKIKKRQRVRADYNRVQIFTKIPIFEQMVIKWLKSRGWKVEPNWDE